MVTVVHRYTNISAMKWSQSLKTLYNYWVIAFVTKTILLPPTPLCTAAWLGIELFWAWPLVDWSCTVGRFSWDYIWSDHLSYWQITLRQRWEKHAFRLLAEISNGRRTGRTFICLCVRKIDSFFIFFFNSSSNKWSEERNCLSQFSVACSKPHFRTRRKLSWKRYLRSNHNIKSYIITLLYTLWIFVVVFLIQTGLNFDEKFIHS